MEKRERAPQQPEVTEFGEFKLESQITWIDEQTKTQFTKPSFGYGEGPFVIKKIDLMRNFEGKIEADPAKKPYTNLVMITIVTPKGDKSLSADYFKVVKA